MQYKSILTPNFSTYNVELQEAFDEGFRLDMNNLPHASFTYYEAVLTKDDEMFDALIEQAVVFPEQAAVKRVGRNKAV